MGVHVCACTAPTSLCDAPALPPHTSVPQEPPLALHPHLTLQIMFLWDLRWCTRGETQIQQTGLKKHH